MHRLCTGWSAIRCVLAVVPPVRLCVTHVFAVTGIYAATVATSARQFPTVARWHVVCVRLLTLHDSCRDRDQLRSMTMKRRVPFTMGAIAWCVLGRMAAAQRRRVLQPVPRPARIPRRPRPRCRRLRQTQYRRPETEVQTRPVIRRETRTAGRRVAALHRCRPNRDRPAVWKTSGSIQSMANAAAATNRKFESTATTHGAATTAHSKELAALFLFTAVCTAQCRVAVGNQSLSSSCSGRIDPWRQRRR